MRKAELTWRRELAGTTIADIRDEVDKHVPKAGASARKAYGRRPA